MISQATKIKMVQDRFLDSTGETMNVAEATRHVAAIDGNLDSPLDEEAYHNEVKYYFAS